MFWRIAECLCQIQRSETIVKPGARRLGAMPKGSAASRSRCTVQSARRSPVAITPPCQSTAGRARFQQRQRQSHISGVYRPIEPRHWRVSRAVRGAGKNCITFRSALIAATRLRSSASKGRRVSRSVVRNTAPRIREMLKHCLDSGSTPTACQPRGNRPFTHCGVTTTGIDARC